MRISDWSSDVCSSDLLSAPGAVRALWHIRPAAAPGRAVPLAEPRLRRLRRLPRIPRLTQAQGHQEGAPQGGRERHPLDAAQRPRHRARSEEQTSELQSLMRISYAVFCLKKKTYNRNVLLLN